MLNHLKWKASKINQFSITKKVYPGETALAFYTATNETNEPIIGKNHNYSQFLTVSHKSLTLNLISPPIPVKFKRLLRCVNLQFNPI